MTPLNDLISSSASASGRSNAANAALKDPAVSFQDVLSSTRVSNKTAASLPAPLVEMCCAGSCKLSDIEGSESAGELQTLIADELFDDDKDESEEITLSASSMLPPQLTQLPIPMTVVSASIFALQYQSSPEGGNAEQDDGGAAGELAEISGLRMDQGSSGHSDPMAIKSANKINIDDSTAEAEESKQIPVAFNVSSSLNSATKQPTQEDADLTAGAVRLMQATSVPSAKIKSMSNEDGSDNAKPVSDPDILPAVEATGRVTRSKTPELKVDGEAGGVHHHEITYNSRGTHIYVGRAERQELTVDQAAAFESVTEGVLSRAGTPAASARQVVLPTAEIELQPADTGVVQEIFARSNTGPTFLDFRGDASSMTPVGELARTSELMRATIEALPKPLQAMTIKIRPEGFGTIQIRVVQQPEGSASGPYRVDIRASDSVAHSLLMTHAIELKQSLQVETVQISGPTMARLMPASETLKDQSTGGGNGSHKGSAQFDFERQGNNRRVQELFELLDESRRPL